MKPKIRRRKFIRPTGHTWDDFMKTYLKVMRAIQMDGEAFLLLSKKRIKK